MVPGLIKIWLWLGGSCLELSAMGIYIHNSIGSQGVTATNEFPSHMIAGQTWSLGGRLMKRGTTPNYA